MAGWSYTSTGNIQAFIDQNGTMTNLEALVPGGESMASAINHSGVVAGKSSTNHGTDEAFIYRNGKMTDLGSFNLQTTPEAINDSGAIVGQTYGENKDGSTFFHAVINTGGKFQDLNNLIDNGLRIRIDRRERPQ